MLSEDRYFQTLTQSELWQRYCGFLDLSISEFMDIQKELLMDEIDRVADSKLGKEIMGHQKPKNVEEFRQMLPLTTYQDYEPYLSERREDALAAKPYLWCHSSGRGGYFKWIPYSPDVVERIAKNSLCMLILATAHKKGQVEIAPGVKLLMTLPPEPYASGSHFRIIAERFSFEPIPHPDLVKGMEFQDRMRFGFRMALKEGVDIITALGSILVRMGEGFSGQTRGMKFSPFMLHPKVVFRLLRARLASKREKRALLPRDLWPLKGIMTAGVDTAIYKNDIAYYWGSEPFEFYACTEALILAVQGWNKKAMTFVPDMAFLEFIPYEEQLKHQDDKDYRPSTALLGEVEEGKLYEVVITQFYGMPLLRYRMKDLVKVTALRDDEAGVNLPQIVFQRRADEAIHLAGLCQLDEKTIWRAIVNTGIRHTDWTACKEFDQNQAFLRLYLELKEDREAAEVEAMIDEQLKLVDVDYRDIGYYLTLQPVRVTLLSPGTFQRYTEEKRKEGADLAHMKPVHVSAPGAVIEHLIELSEAG